MAKQIKVREDNYFAVQGWMVTELKLKGNALMLYAIIYGFSQTTNTAFTGSVDYLCEWLGGVSRPTVINTLDNLVKQGLLTKSSTTKGALIYNSYTALRPSKKILSDEDPTSKKTLPDTSKNFLLNKDSKDNAIKAVDEYYKDTVYPDTRLGNLSKVFNLSEEDIKSSGYVVDSLEASIWCLYNSSSYKEAVLKAVNLGEDTDTIGAITGSLAGLFIGGDHLPKEWVDSLQAKSKILQIVDRFYEQYK